MNLRLAWEHLKALPPQSQQAVADFIDFLRGRDISAPAPVSKALGDDPAIGMWAGRDDMPDGPAWVNALREQAWGSRDGAAGAC